MYVASTTLRLGLAVYFILAAATGCFAQGPAASLGNYAASILLAEINVPAVAQLAGDADWGAGVTLLQADIAYWRHDYDSARRLVAAVTPVFTRKEAEPYQRHVPGTLNGELSRVARTDK